MAMTLEELKPGELELQDLSEETRRYQCGHEGAKTFRIYIGEHGGITSELIDQEVRCPKCVFDFTCSTLHRCPGCQKIYEVVPGSMDSTVSSLRHFYACFPTMFQVLGGGA